MLSALASSAAVPKDARDPLISPRRYNFQGILNGQSADGGV